jgi:MFS superfamily sulfate permease-like transporter
MLGVVTFAPLRRYFRVNRPDWVFYLGAMLGILFFGIIQGILIGVVLSLLLLIARASKPGIRRLGRDPKADVYVDVDRYTGLELVSGVVAVRMGGPLFFADANRFRDALNELIRSNREPVRALVVDATAISQTDTDGADIVIQIAEDLRSRGVSLAFAHVEPAILELWTRAGAIEAIGPDRIFETVRGAVRALETGPTATAASTSAP